MASCPRAAYVDEFLIAEDFNHSYTLPIETCKDGCATDEMAHEKAFEDLENAKDLIDLQHFHM